MKPNLVDEDIDKIVNTMEESIVQKKGELIKKPIIEKRRFAYQIDKFADGYYCFLYYVGDAEISKRMEEVCRLNENVLRFVNFRLETRDNILGGIKDSQEVEVESHEEEDEEEGE